MDEPLKILLSVVITVLVASALILLVDDGSFITGITTKITDALTQITW